MQRYPEQMSPTPRKPPRGKYSRETVIMRKIYKIIYSGCKMKIYQYSIFLFLFYLCNVLCSTLQHHPVTC